MRFALQPKTKKRMPNRNRETHAERLDAELTNTNDAITKRRAALENIKMHSNCARHV